MVWLDARLPIRFGALDLRQPHEAVLTDNSPAALPAAMFQPALPGSHPPDCTCCANRNGAAVALAELFRHRAMSSAPPFKGVLAVVGAAGEAEIRDALAADPLVAARFRLSQLGTS